MESFNPKVEEVKNQGLLLQKRINKTPSLYIAQYIDDSLTVGRLKDTLSLKQHMNDNRLTTKYDELEEYLGCRIVFSKDKNKVWLGQLETIKKLERLFGNEVKHLGNTQLEVQLVKEY